MNYNRSGIGFFNKNPLDFTDNRAWNSYEPSYREQKLPEGNTILYTGLRDV